MFIAPLLIIFFLSERQNSKQPLCFPVSRVPLSDLEPCLLCRGAICLRYQDKIHQGMLLSRSGQDSCVAQATEPAHAGACNFRWPVSSGTHLFTGFAKQSRDRWDFLWSPALPPRGKPGHLYCHLTAKLVRPCTGHVRDTCSVWVLCTRERAAVALPGCPACAWSRPALLTAFSPLLCFGFMV